MQGSISEDSKSRQVYVSALGKNLLREAFLGNTDFTYKQQSVFHPTTPPTQTVFEMLQLFASKKAQLDIGTFAPYDEEQSGHITRESFKTILESFDIEATDDQIQDIIETLDVLSTGFVNYYELLALYYSLDTYEY